MVDFGWSYPPCCSGPPEEPEPHPLVFKLDDLLLKCGQRGSTDEEIEELEQELIEGIESLAIDAERDCPQCLKRWEIETEKELENEMAGLILLKDVANLESDYEVASLDLNQEYWYPEKEGELKRLVFWEIDTRKCLDQQSQTEIDLECAVFVEPLDDGNHRSIANGSKRLVAMFENNGIQKGTPVQVTYLGKKKNKTNSNSSDHWSVHILQKKKGGAK